MSNESTRGAALIVGAGRGLSASLARLCAADGMPVVLAARNPDKLAELCAETGGVAIRCDASVRNEVDALFDQIASHYGAPELVVFNPSKRARGPIAELDPEEVREALMVSCYGGFLVGRRAAQAMLQAGRGTILFTGATASVKGFSGSAPFAMGKFGLRGLVQSMARELGPKNIHVAHFIIDGGIGRASPDDTSLDPDAIAQTYMAIHKQPRSAWTWEVELRPWTESF